MKDAVVDKEKRMNFTLGMIEAREMDLYEVEFLKEAAQKDEEQLLEALRCVFGMETAAYMLKTAENACVLAEYSLNEMMNEQQGGDDRKWKTNVSIIGECVGVCECAYALAKKVDPSLCVLLAAGAGRTREAHKAAICKAALLMRRRV